MGIKLFGKELILKSVKESTSNFFQKFGNAFASTDSKFARDIFTRKRKDMHQEFREAKLAYFNNALVHAAVDKKVNIILGDNREIETLNPVLKKFLEDQYMPKKGFDESVVSAVTDAIATGNGYIEKALDPKGKVVRYIPFFNAEDMYIDYDFQKDIIKGYVQRVLTGSREKSEINKKARTHTIWTPEGWITVHGVYIAKNKIIHLKYKNNVFGVYGRSDVCAALNSIEILEVMERALAVIAKYKAVPKKALVRKADEFNDLPSDPEMIDISKKLKQMSDFENPLLPGGWEVLDLSDGGKDIRLEGYIDHLKRTITISMAPEFLIHGESTNRATSKEQKQLYFIEIEADRKPFELIFTKELKAQMELSKRPALQGEFKYTFGNFDILLTEEKESITLTRWNDGLLTLNETRVELGLPPVADVDVFKWETTQPAAVPGFENLSLIKNENKKESKGTIEKKKLADPSKRG